MREKKNKERVVQEEREGERNKKVREKKINPLGAFSRSSGSVSKVDQMTP